jgi:hypothetical protein
MSLPRQACPSFDMVVLLRGSQAISYDNVHETHTPGDKWDFLRKYGYPVRVWIARLCLFGAVLRWSPLAQPLLWR